MKNRIGFVSNSSSSSFILAVNKKNSDNVPLKVTVEIDLSKYVNKWIATLEELEEYSKNSYQCYGSVMPHYAECKKAVEAGKTVLIGEFSSDGGDEVSAMLRYKGLSAADLPEAEIIFSEAE